MSASPPDVVTCYRHPGREAPLGCTRCGNPICLDDAIDAPVGYLCPDCAQQPKRVQRAQAAVARSQNTTVTKVLLGAMVAAYLLGPVLTQAAGISLFQEGALFGPAVGAGDWYRLVSSGFLHAGLIHIGFNGYLLWVLGQMLERGTGPTRYLALFLGGLFGGGLGALLLSYGAATIGASGAVFGLMGAAMVGLRRRGVNPFQSQIGSLVVINLVFTFLFPGISIGGHLGGLAGGALVGFAVFHLDGDRAQLGTAAGWGIVAVLAILGVVVGVAGSPFA